MSFLSRPRIGLRRAGFVCTGATRSGTIWTCSAFQGFVPTSKARIMKKLIMTEAGMFFVLLIAAFCIAMALRMTVLR